jgi:hypothetical protein
MRLKSGGKPENIKAMSAHRGLAVFYFLLAIVFGVVLAAEDKPGAVFAITMFPVLIGAIHAAIAFGARKSAGWARVCSIGVACLMLLAIPIGTLIGVYLLLNSKWSTPAGAGSNDA